MSGAETTRSRGRDAFPAPAVKARAQGTPPRTVPALARFRRPALAWLAVLPLLTAGLAPTAPASAQEPDPLTSEATPATEMRVPEDMELDSLARRAAEQRAAAAGWTAFHGFGFSDRLAESGIGFRHQIVDDAGVHYKAVHYDHGNGLAAADVDGDGRIDLYFSSQLGGNELWRNLGGGRFEDWTERASVALADRIGVSASFADVDNDGDADLFATSVRGGNALLLNDGSGRFRDVTAESGLGYSGHSSAGVFFDYDRDGLLDLFLANVGVYTRDERGRGGYFIGLEDAFNGHLFPERAERSILYKNLGGGRFRDVSEEALLLDRSWSGDAVPFDADGDGFLDLYVLDMQGPDRFYQNVEGRFFADRTEKLFPRTPPGTMGAGVLDWNRDGRLDLLLTDMHSDMIENVGPEREKEKARPPQGTPAEVIERSVFGNALFEATDGGGFREVSDAAGVETYWPWGLSVADLNADGWEDAFVTGSMNYPFRYGINSVLLNDGGRRFVDAEFVLGVEPRAEPLQPWFELDCPAEAEAADAGAEGDAAKPGGEDGGAAEPMAAWKVFSHPGHAAGGGSGNGGPHPHCEGLSGRVAVVAARGSRASVVFDLDGDGDLDVVTNELNAPPQVLVSDLAERRPVRFVEVELRGTRSNRDGLGARVTLVTGAGSETGAQVRSHDGKSGYLSQSRLPLYFGLGEGEEPLRLEVEWPSGARQTVERPEVGKRTTVVEPAPEGDGEGEGEGGNRSAPRPAGEAPGSD